MTIQICLSGPVVYTAGRNCFLPSGLHPLGGCGRAAGIGICHTKQDQDEQCGIYDGWPRRCCGRCLFGCQELPQASGGEVSPARAEVLASVWTFASSCTTAYHRRAGVWGMPLCKPSLGVLPWLAFSCRPLASCTYGLMLQQLSSTPPARACASCLSSCCSG